MSLDSVFSVVSSALDVLNYVVVPIKRQFGYVVSSKSYAQDLQNEVDKLAYKAQMVHDTVEADTNNGRNVFPYVTQWQAKAEKALKGAQDLSDDFKKETKTCCYGSLPEPICRYQFSRKAKDKIKGIQQLDQEYSGLKDNISSSGPAPGNVAAQTSARGEGKVAVQSPTMMVSTSSPSTSTQLRDDDVFKSRELIMQEIMAALADNNNSVVGIHGMGGVGKSTLLVDVERRIRKEKSFDWVAKADVSENQDIKRIQGEIADLLGLTDIKNKESDGGRAELLRKRLEDEESKKKKVLIILDNLWKGLDLKSVGIPCGHDNKVIGCKLLLTSRDRHILRREMGCDRDFHLNELEKEEAKRLFERTVGDKVHDDPFNSLVDEALLKCAGFPFLIIAMAKIFKDADLSEWKVVLRQIEMSANKGIDGKINEMLQMSYNRFEGEDGAEAKSLLRLCVVYGVSKPSLENLVRYGVGSRLFQENSSMEEVRDRLSTLIRTLQASSLLLVDDEDADGFKIHDLVRGFIASVASRDDPLLVWKDNNKSMTELAKDKLKSCTAVCFPYVDMEKLPEELDCPEMRIFLLFRNNESLKVPDSYFNSMRKLMVLHLSQIILTPSPSPFQFLVNLHTLCLDSCSLANVAMIGELKGLHILSFVGSNIQRLPKEIGQLIELKLLDLNDCSQLEIIEPGVLGSLMKLEELYMENSFDQWNVVEETPPTNAKLIELNNMKNLYTLHVSILNPSMLPEDLNVEKLTKYRIQMGDVKRWRSRKGLSTLELKLDPTSDFLQKGCIQTFLGKTDDLFLDGLNGVEQSICALSQEGFAKLKHLNVKSSPSVHYVLQSPSHIDFKMLESLLLKKLVNLEKICNSHISSKSFNSLKVLLVNSCDKMEVLFPLSLLRELPQLEEIRVVKCDSMREIVGVDDCCKVELRNLHVLELRDLPNLKNFCTAETAPSSSTSNEQVAFFNGQQVSIPSLESLTMAGLPNLKDIWTDESPLDLSNLQSLNVSSCKSLSKVIDCRSLLKLHKLHTLEVKDCILVQEIFDLDGLDASENVETRFELISIWGLPSLRCIWNKIPCGIMRFHNLRRFKVYGCDNLRFLFFPSMVHSLAQLRELEVRNCEKMEAIIMEEEGLEIDKTSETLVFPMLIKLRFHNLESFTCFSRRKCSRKAQSQDRVEPCSTALFNHEVSIPSLESLSMSGLPNLNDICSDESSLGLSNLHSLEVVRCDSLSKVINFGSLVKLQKLRTLTVRDCVSVQEIFDLEGLSTSGNVEILSELTAITVSNLPSLRHVWNKNPCGIVRFHTLKELGVYGCGNLGFLFFPSMVKFLAQLRKLTVLACKKMEAIIMEEEGLEMETSETLAFPMLTDLRLQYLKSLTCFSRGKCSREDRNQDSVKSRSTALFNQEVTFPNLETLTINGMDNIETIWDNQVAPESFHKLKSLDIWSCNKLVNIIPSCILGRLESLESLKARFCGSLEVVFKLQPLNPLGGHPVATFPLKKLELQELPELKCVWDKELHSQVKFQCLRFVTISRCKSLTSLFPTSIAKDLMQLEELKINECGIVELIEKEGLVPKDVFPRLTSLKLEHLTELKCIYDGICALCWLALKTLKVHGCNKVDMLASQLENEMPLHKQPLFLIEKGAFPNLEELNVDLSERTEIWHDYFHDGEFFCKLRVLKLNHISKESAISTCRFVQSLTNLEKLVVNESCLEELSNSIEAIEGQSHEGKLILPSSRYFQHLQSLKVSNCHGSSLYAILSFPRFFRHLETLDVSRCDGLSNMFTPTIAGNLVELTKLRISNCKKLTEIICDDGGEERLVVAFKQLKRMELDGLTRLRCFSSMKYTLMFPLLEDVIVSGCPSMKFFSGGSIEAKKLERVQVSTEAWFWKENLNITIQNMFEELATFVRIKFMWLSEFPEMITKWHSELNPIKSSWQLESLAVDKCPSFINAIPSKLMLVLENLVTLRVWDCESLEEIFDLEGLEAVESTRVLPSLRYLDLVNLPKLRRLWNSDFQGMLCFKFISSLALYNCSNLRHAFAPSMARSLANLSQIKIKECGQMEGVIAEEEGQGSAVEKIKFPMFFSIELECLPNLTSFLSGKNHTLECPVLGQLTIAHCPKMRSLTWQYWMEIDHGTPSLFTPQVQFPKLRSMVLSYMDKLSNIWTDSRQETLTSKDLCEVKVENCKSLENLFPHWVATSLNQLEELQVEFCMIKEIVVSGDDTSHSTTTQVLFPNLTSLVLHNMSQLKSFSPNLSTLNWPFLKEFRATHCDKLNMFPFAASIDKWVQRDDQEDLSEQEAQEAQEAHSSFERDFPT